jgi:hypothetical protein
MGHVEDAAQLVRMEHGVGRRGVDAYFAEHFGDEPRGGMPPLE